MTQTTKKKGLWAKFSGLWSRPKPEDNIEMKMSQWGMSIEAQKDLQSRLHVQKLVHKYLSSPITETENSKILDKIQRKLDILSAAIALTGTPWATPGDNSVMARKIQSWEGDYADATVFIDAMKRYYVTPKKEKEENKKNPIEYENINADDIVNQTKKFITVHVFAPGKIVMDSCFFDKHVTPKHIAMVQALFPQKQQLPYGYGPASPSAE